MFEIRLTSVAELPQGEAAAQVEVEQNENFERQFLRVVNHKRARPLAFFLVYLVLFGASGWSWWALGGLWPFLWLLAYSGGRLLASGGSWRLGGPLSVNGGLWCLRFWSRRSSCLEPERALQSFWFPYRFAPICTYLSTWAENVMRYKRALWPFEHPPGATTPWPPTKQWWIHSFVIQTLAVGVAQQGTDMSLVQIMFSHIISV